MSPNRVFLAPKIIFRVYNLSVYVHTCVYARNCALCLQSVARQSSRCSVQFATANGFGRLSSFRGKRASRKWRRRRRRRRKGRSSGKGKRFGWRARKGIDFKPPAIFRYENMKAISVPVGRNAICPWIYRARDRKRRIFLGHCTASGGGVRSWAGVDPAGWKDRGVLLTAWKESGRRIKLVGFDWWDRRWRFAGISLRRARGGN